MELPYTIFALGDAVLHQLHTDQGKVRARVLLCVCGTSLCFFHFHLAPFGFWLVGNDCLGRGWCPPGFDRDVGCCSLTAAAAHPAHDQQLFIMSEVATQLFQESPIAFGKVRRCHAYFLIKCGGE